MTEVEHFVGADKMAQIRKKVIALAQTYFAVQTTKQELTDKV